MLHYVEYSLEWEQISIEQGAVKMGHLAFMQTLSFTLPRGGVKRLVRYAVKFFCVVLFKIAIAGVGRVG